VAACSDRTPTEPTGPPSLTGSWLSDDRRLRLDLVQSLGDVHGTARYLDDTRPALPIIREMVDGGFGFRVVTGRDVATFLDPPEEVESGWRVTGRVTDGRITGTISWFGIPGRYPRVIQPITFSRVDHVR
jgi:hypothetical protein